MVECRHCGTSADGQARFCPNCGERLDDGADGTAADSPGSDRAMDDEWGSASRGGTVTKDRQSTSTKSGTEGRATDRQTGRSDRRSTGTDHGRPVDSAQKDTTMAALAHVAALFTWVVGPLVVMAAADDSFAEENARNALNWQVSYTVYGAVAFVLAFGGMFAMAGMGGSGAAGMFGLLGGMSFMLVFGLMFALGLANMAFCIIAALKATDGETWSYPFSLDVF